MLNFLKSCFIAHFVFPIFLKSMLQGLNLLLGQNKAHIDLLPTRHKVVHNCGSPNLSRLLFHTNTTDMAQILQSLRYKECSIISPKFTTSSLFIVILGTSTIMNQTACCYVVTTSEIGLYTKFVK